MQPYIFIILRHFKYRTFSLISPKRSIRCASFIIIYVVAGHTGGRDTCITLFARIIAIQIIESSHLCPT